MTKCQHADSSLGDMFKSGATPGPTETETANKGGISPGACQASGSHEVIVYACRATGLGRMVLAATDKGVCSVCFGDDEALLIARLKVEFPTSELTPSPAGNALAADVWADALNQHISQRAPLPDLPLDMRGTAFQMTVWQCLLNTRDGDVLSYSEVAARIGRPRAVRAVASACGQNRIGVLIPCHRVLRSDGSLGGYRWGLDRKRVLLRSERMRRDI